MKKSVKKILCTLLVAIMCLTSIPLSSFTIAKAANETTYITKSDLESGYVYFGSYPQSEVTDTTTISALNAKAPSWDSWTSYGYYSGTGDFGTMVSGDWMRYTDVTYNGEKYRGVKFTQYRPISTVYSSSSLNSCQPNSRNSYYINTIYWFKFESLKWRVLDADTGLIMCETIIDSQPYSNTIYCNSNGSDDEYDAFNDSSYTHYASDYETSSIRTWLNNDFYNTAFTSGDQSIITTSTLNNDSCYALTGGTIGYEKLNSNDTEDKVFLLSLDESINSNYGFSSSGNTYDTARQAQGSDYAKCQGLWVTTESYYEGNSTWLLRSPGHDSSVCCIVIDYGCTYLGYYSVNDSSYGVRPALKLNMSSATDLDLSQSHIYFGSYPQSKVTDNITISVLNSLAPDWDEWTSYGYYSRTDDYSTMVQGDWMRYTDVTYNGEKYRGVKFTQYRPFFTAYDSSTDNSYQDDNGYFLKTIYWFKFESLKWRVLDANTGLIMCETVIDVQPYCNTIYYDSSVSDSAYRYFNDASYTHYASDYKTSSIRAWLNNDFYNTAFTSTDQRTIATTKLNNDGYYTLTGTSGYEKLDSKETNDKIFLLSYNEVKNSNYFSSDSKREAQSSDYAKCQGLYTSNIGSNIGNCVWLLRSPGYKSDYQCQVGTDGYAGTLYYTVDHADHGVRPTLKLDVKSLHTHSYTSSVTKEATHTEEGETTYTCACGDTYTESIEKTKEHTYTSEVTKEATHTEEGETTYTCACGDTYTESIDKLADHVYVAEVTVKATCTEGGKVTYTCACGDTYTDTIPATGHTFSGSKCTTCGYDRSDSCSCNCHASGIAHFFFVIVNFFQKLFGNNKVCDCGAKH